VGRPQHHGGVLTFDAGKYRLKNAAFSVSKGFRLGKW
jgi:hypothetical protein